MDAPVPGRACTSRPGLASAARLVQTGAASIPTATLRVLRHTVATLVLEASAQLLPRGDEVAATRIAEAHVSAS
jgi:hypothetical protein